MPVAGRTHIPIIDHEKCNACRLCRLLCPDLAITRNGNKGKIEIDYDYCKGCGICEAICPREAIKMVVEEKGVLS